MGILDERSAFEIYQILGGTKGRNGREDYWLPCPCHNEKTPSFHVQQVGNKVRIHCFVGCSFKNLIAAIDKAAGISRETNWQPKPRLPSQAPAPTAPPPFTPIFPAPRPLADRDRIDPTLGQPTSLFPYHNAKGQILGYVARFQLRNGKKTFRPLLYARSAEGNVGWTFKTGFPSPRPLYNLHKIAATNASVPIIISEGEKAADAAERLFPTWVSTASLNGCQSPQLTDFSPLKGRILIIAPDDDPQGTHFASTVSLLARAAGAAIIYLLDWPYQTMPVGHGFAKSPRPANQGDDLADAEQDGWTADLIKSQWAHGWRPLLRVLRPGENALINNSAA